jgi:hypothetical protein
MGRKRIEIEIPSHPFTTRDLEDKYPALSFNFFHVRLRELVRGGEVRIIGKRRAAGKGKAWSLYAKDFEDSKPAATDSATSQPKHGIRKAR